MSLIFYHCKLDRFTSNSGKIILREPGIPMILQRSLSGIIILILTKGPFVDDIIVSCSFKQRGSDERFSHQPLQIRAVSKLSREVRSLRDSLRQC